MELFDPVIFFGPNVCPNCGTIGMNLAMLEINVMNVRSNGSMTYHHTSGPIYRLACNECGWHTDLVEIPKYGPIRLKSPVDGYIYPCVETIDPYESVEEKTFEGNPFADEPHIEFTTNSGKKIHVYGDPNKCSTEFKEILKRLRGISEDV